MWNGFLLGKAKKEEAPCRFCGQRNGDGDLYWECTLPPVIHVRELTEFASLMSLDRYGMVGCLGLVLLVRGTPGLPPLVSWLAVLWNAVSVRILWIVLVSGSRQISGTG